MKTDSRRYWRRITAAILGTILASQGNSAQNMLVLTDGSATLSNGASHVSDLVAAFTAAGAAITLDGTKLTDGQALTLAEITGWDVVLVVSVSGNAIDSADIPALQAGVTTKASSEFMFFLDACASCTRASTEAALPILNSAGCWNITLGAGENTYPYTATLNSGSVFSSSFSQFPTITAGAYAPLIGAPDAAVLYFADAVNDGPMAMFAPGSSTSACLYFATDTTQFWQTGGIITQTQADGLAAAYLGGVCGYASSVQLCAGNGTNVDVLSLTPAVIGQVWNPTVAIGHPHGTGGSFVLHVRTSCFNGPTIASPIGGRNVQILVSGPLVASLSGTHDGATGTLAPAPTVPCDVSLVGLPWAAQATVSGGGFVDLSTGLSGVIGAF